MTIKQSVCYPMIKPADIPLADFVAQVAELGYTAIELWGRGDDFSIRWIGHFHTAGIPGRRDFDDTQELNYAGICRAIAESGYNDYVGHEFRPKGEVYTALRRAFEICDQ